MSSSSIISLENILPNDLVFNNKGIFYEDKKMLMKIENVNVKYAGDNSKFESDPAKVKKYIKFTINDHECRNKLKMIASKQSNECKNLFFTEDDDAVVFVCFLTEKTKLFDKNKKPLKISNESLSDLRGCSINMLVNIYTIENDYGKFERMMAYQVKMNSSKLFEECII